jgi:hypothetical protein
MRALELQRRAAHGAEPELPRKPSKAASFDHAAWALQEDGGACDGDRDYSDDNDEKGRGFGDAEHSEALVRASF